MATVWERLYQDQKDDKWRATLRDKVMREVEQASRSGRNALLHDSVPLCIGDAYVDPGRRIQKLRDKGPRMKTAWPKRGPQKGCFTQLVPLDVGSRFLDAWARRTLERREKLDAPSGVKENRKPFRSTATPTKQKYADAIFLAQVDKSADKGTLRRLVTKSKQEASRPKSAAPLRPRNVVVNPPPRGSYGFPKLLIGERGVDSKVQRIHAYQTDPYERSELVRRQDASRSGKPPLDRPPFRSRVSTWGVPTFATNQQAFGPTEGAQAPADALRPTSAPVQRKARGEGEQEEAPPFKYPHPPKRGGPGTADPHLSIGAYPEHMVDPYKPPGPQLGPKDKGVPRWVPSNPPKARPTSSVMLRRTSVMKEIRNVSRGRR